MSCNAGALTVGTRAAFAGDDLFCEQTMAALVAGVSTRTFIDAILDEGLACHMTFVSEGIPFVLSMAYARCGDVLYLHGARGSRLLQALGDRPQVCVTVTLLDGLVLAASALSHSMNYRSAVVIARAAAVSDPAEKLAALRRCRSTPSPAAERTSDLPSKQELAATTVLSLPLDQASAKVRCGAPVDAPADRDSPVWVGEIPLTLSASAPVSVAAVAGKLPVPGYAASHTERRAVWLRDRQAGAGPDALRVAEG